MILSGVRTLAARCELDRSLQNPHPESAALAEQDSKTGRADCRRKTSSATSDFRSYA
jgi:hypothetical protein